MKKPTAPVPPLAYSFRTLSQATDISESLLRQAAQADELKTRLVTIAGVERKSRRITPADAEAFVDLMMGEDSR